MNREDFEVEVILDTVSEESFRFLTFRIRCPRMIWAEFLTHRVFSRNARSSRAVPSKKLVEEGIYVPNFLANGPGMQAKEEMDPAARQEAEGIWRALAKTTRLAVQRLEQLGVHKQWANRPLEWHSCIDGLVSSTEWENFFKLRRKGFGAQPEFETLAEMMWKAREFSVPAAIRTGEWRLPYVSPADYDSAYFHLREKDVHPSDRSVAEVLRRVSAARCARISYEPFDGNASFERELERYDKLVADPERIHGSALEHVATPDSQQCGVWRSRHLHGNTEGWCQYRRFVELGIL